MAKRETLGQSSGQTSSTSDGFNPNPAAAGGAALLKQVVRVAVVHATLPKLRQLSSFELSSISRNFSVGSVSTASGPTHCCSHPGCAPAALALPWDPARPRAGLTASSWGHPSAARSGGNLASHPRIHAKESSGTRSTVSGARCSRVPGTPPLDSPPASWSGRLLTEPRRPAPLPLTDA